MTHFNRTPEKTERARELRRNSTDCEARLWARLRDNRMGPSFRRQHPIGPYYVDFYCPSAKFVVELDGEQHGTDKSMAYDVARTRFLESKGLHVLRVANWQLKEDIDDICETIYRAVNETPTRRASRVDLPLSGGGRIPSDT